MPQLQATRPGLVGRIIGVPRWLWREVAGIAEMLSDAGHGPTRWRDRSDIDNPYAGSGPAEPPESPYGSDDDQPGSNARRSMP